MSPTPEVGISLRPSLPCCGSPSTNCTSTGCKRRSARNAASRRVAEKLKLRDEGTAQRYLEINGVWEDHIRFAITSEDWSERGEELIGEWIGF